MSNIICNVIYAILTGYNYMFQYRNSVNLFIILLRTDILPINCYFYLYLM